MLQNHTASKAILFFCFLVLPLSHSYSQKVFRSTLTGDMSFYAGIGASKLQGDLGGYVKEKPLYTDAHPTFSLGFRYISPVGYGFAISIAQNSFSGNDSTTHNDGRTKIPMNYQSSEWEINTQFEYSIIGGGYFENYLPHRLYVISGAGMAFSNSKVLNYRPTDKVKEFVIAPSIFAGIGYHYRITDVWGLGVEFRGTYFLSDQIDGIHIPKWSKNNDYSNEIKFTVSFHIPEWTGVQRCNCSTLH